MSIGTSFALMPHARKIGLAVFCASTLNELPETAPLPYDISNSNPCGKPASAEQLSRLVRDPAEADLAHRLPRSSRSRRSGRKLAGRVAAPPNSASRMPS
jgi:hypothetical protein